MFGRSAGDGEVLLDETTAYLSGPGIEESFTHPVDGGDVCTAIRFEPALLATLMGGDPLVSVSSLPLCAGDHVAIGRLTATGPERFGHCGKPR